jgi:hypothetical protein
MIFNNPKYTLKEDNVYTLRKREYDKLWDYVQNIVGVVTLPECGAFNIEELYIKESLKEDKFELMPTKKGEIVIQLKKNNKEINLSMYFPILINDQYIFINGMQKIPILQCFDLPIITKGTGIKVRSNVATILITSQDKPNSSRVFINFAGTTVPLALVVLAKYGIEESKKFLEIVEIPDNLYGKFLMDLHDYIVSSDNYIEKDFITDIGRESSRGGDPYSSGKDFIFKLDLILKVDIFTAKFFETNSMIDELVKILNIGDIDDNNYINKRLRFLEYLILAPLIKTVYEFCTSNYDTTKPKFSVNPKQIITDCNISEIVQYDFSYNPIEEATKLTRISLLGPGGFKRDSVPPHLRDMNDSMYGRICAIDTPDRENCGIIMSVIPNCEYDGNLKFEEPGNQTVSTAISMIPFLEHNDPTRLQMASSQMRQSILLEKFQEPLIKSGCEHIYSNYTQFIKRAKKKGTICSIDSNYIVVFYEDGEIDIIDVSIRNIYGSNVDYYNICVTEGEQVEKNQIIIESQFMKNGNMVFGNNLFTGIVPYYGYNFEDGIVISERLVNENILTSTHYTDLSFLLPANKILIDLGLDKGEGLSGEYMPLPFSLHDYTRRMEEIKLEFDKKIYKDISPEKYKELSEKFISDVKKLEEKRIIGFGPSKPYAIIQDIEKTEDYFSESTKLYAHNNNTRIAKITIYANKWHRDKFPQFSNWVEEKLVMQQDQEKKFVENLSRFVNKEQLKQMIRKHNLNRFQINIDGDKISQNNNFKLKGENFNGIYFEISGLFRRPIMVGDKLGNRHGNKGVVAKIIPQEKMPQVDGKPLDVLINPLGIISRMNLGQLYELHLSMSLEDLKDKLNQILKDDKNSIDIKKYLLDYIEIIDNTEGRWYHKQFKEQIENIIIDEKFIEELTLIQPPFESLSYDKLIQAMNYTGTEMEKIIYDPIINKNIMNPIAIGNMYIYRIVHIAEEKLSSRSIGPYTRRTLQPLRGRKNKGGQRLGEMEVACLISHNALANLHECLTLKSDDIEQKNEWLQKQITKTSLNTVDSDGKVEAVRLLESYLKVLGIEY